MRNLDDSLIAKLKMRAAATAARQKPSTEGFCVPALQGETEPDFDSLAADLRNLTASRQQTPVEDLLREGRDER